MVTAVCIKLRSKENTIQNGRLTQPTFEMSSDIKMIKMVYGITVQK